MRRPAALLAAVAILLAVAAPVRAAGPEILDASATATFNQQLEFRADVRIDAPLRRAEILLEFPGTIGPYVREVAVPAGTGTQALVFRWSFAQDGHLYPNTRIRASWRLIPADGSPPVTGGARAITYTDDRFNWQTLTGSLVRLHWYEGSDAFAKRALAIGEEGVRKVEDLLGVTETEPVDFFIYATSSDFYDAMGPGTRENVGGTAITDIRTLFANIGPAGVDDPWVANVLPHELTHLVFATATDNPYNGPPRWLNEGVAQYLAAGYRPSDRGEVEAAVADGRIIPLTALGGLFPTSRDPFYLAYAESVAAVDFMVATYGRDALVALIRSYATGVTDDEAFRAALGTDVAGFEGAWLAKIGARMPQQYGPQAAPPGPIPAGWEGEPPGGETATPGPGASPGAIAGATAGPGSPVPGASPAPGGEGSGSSGPVLVIVVVAAGAVGLSAAVGLRRRAGPPGSP